jgi:Flp pilus assembly protein TadD
MRQDATPASITGRDPLARTIDRLIAREDFGHAADKIRELLNQSPDHVQARRKLGYCLLRAGRNEEAEEAFATVLTSHPGDPFALLYQGVILARCDRLSEAVALWRRYFNTDQPVIQRAVNLQVALFDSGGPKDGREAAEHILQAVADQQKLDQG